MDEKYETLRLSIENLIGLMLDLEKQLKEIREGKENLLGKDGKGDGTLSTVDERGKESGVFTPSATDRATTIEPGAYKLNDGTWRRPKDKEEMLELLSLKKLDLEHARILNKATREVLEERGAKWKKGSGAWAIHKQLDLPIEWFWAVMQ